jgi:hypothetical protein
MTGLQPASLIESQIARGEQLAGGKWKPYLKNLNGVDRSFTAICLENTANFLAGLDETVRAVNVGQVARL